MKFALHPGIDAAALARTYAATGRVRIQPFLADDCAAALHAALRAREDWLQVINSGSKIFELSRAARAAMPAERTAALDQAVIAGAREGFQHRYEAIRLPDGDAPPGDGTAGWPRWLSSGAPLKLLHGITGTPIAFADAQATAYSPGDFLTGHDDAVAGKGRLAAYVLGLTPVWRLEWGGLLLFHDTGSQVSGVVPGYNSLDLFAVPQVHSVSAVTASAAYRRYAVTGWLRGPRP